MDNVSASIRSRTMSRIKSTNSKPEVRVAKALLNAGFLGYRKHWAVPGKPDFSWPGRKIALFVDGCFWHRCPKCCRIPSSNQEYWITKLSRNQCRDLKTNALLRSLGWAVIRVRECEIADARFLKKLQKAMSARPPRSR